MKISPRRFLCLLSALLLIGVSSACILGGRNERRARPGDLDFNLGPFTYIEEGKLIALAVGTEAARYREKEKYIPIAVAIANKGARPLTLTRESFSLQDENGKRYGVVPVSELNAGYGPSQMDRTFTGSFSIFLSRFSTYERAGSNFFPSQASPGIVIDRVELHRYYNMLDWLYFPTPEDGVLGRRFELHLECQGLDEGVFVKFRID
jgi:hypothetical protein